MNRNPSFSPRAIGRRTRRWWSSFTELASCVLASGLASNECCNFHSRVIPACCLSFWVCCRLIINNSLDHGTQRPYIKWAKEHGYSVLVLNTNYNTQDDDKKKPPIPVKHFWELKIIKLQFDYGGYFEQENHNPPAHGIYVWQNFVAQSSAKRVAIVAHSAGGIVTQEMVRKSIGVFS